MGFPPGITFPREDCRPRATTSSYDLERQSSLGEVIPGRNPTGMSYLYIVVSCQLFFHFRYRIFPGFPDRGDGSTSSLRGEEVPCPLYRSGGLPDREPDGTVYNGDHHGAAQLPECLPRSCRLDLPHVSFWDLLLSSTHRADKIVRNTGQRHRFR